MSDEIPTKYCRRIESNVFAEKSEDITKRVYVQCKFYEPSINRCVTDFLKDRRCLVKLAVEREK